MPTSLCLIRLVLQPRQLEVMNSRLVLDLLLLSLLDRLVSASQTLSPSWMFMVTFRQLDLLRQEPSCMVMVRESLTYQVIHCGFKHLLVFIPFQQMLVLGTNRPEFSVDIRGGAAGNDGDLFVNGLAKFNGITQFDSSAIVSGIFTATDFRLLDSDGIITAGIATINQFINVGASRNSIPDH